MITLDQLPLNKKAIILENDLDTIPLKLIKLGLLPNSEIEVLQKSILNDPIYIRVDSSFLSIRKSLAQSILVSIEE